MRKQTHWRKALARLVLNLYIQRAARALHLIAKATESLHRETESATAAFRTFAIALKANRPDGG
jgi:hypothetical protein